MILATHGILQSAGDIAYSDILSYATSLGYTLPSSGQQVKQAQLLDDLKAAGIWDKLDTFVCLATDGSSNFALIDWKRLSLYTAVNSPTFTTNGGFTGNGTSSYIDTNFNPTIGTNNFKLNDASFGGLVDIAVANTGYFVGTSIGNVNLIRKNSSGNQRINQGAAGVNIPTGDFSVFKFIGLHRNSNLGGAYTYDGNTVNYLSNSTSIANSNQFILRSAALYANFQARIFYMGASLISESPSFFTAINTYVTSL